MMHDKYIQAEETFPLSRASAGQEVHLIRVNGGRRINHRLAELGLTPGVKLKVLQDAGCALVLSVRNSRIALGRGMASMVEVNPIQHEIKTPSTGHQRETVGSGFHGLRSQKK